MSVIPNSGNGKITVPELLQRKSSSAASKLIHENYLFDGVRLSDGTAFG